MSNTKILIVDDNPTNLKLVNVLLTVEGYETRTAMDAEEVLNVLNTYRPALILMDIQLPKMDGLELTTKLKADPLYKDIIILAVTSYAMKGDEEKAIAAGCDGYVSKPIDVEALPRIISSYFDKK